MILQIPGIAVVGPIFRPSIDIGVQVDSVLGFSYGFDLTVCFVLPAPRVFIHILKLDLIQILGAQQRFCLD